MNDIGSPKIGGQRPYSSQVVGASCPHYHSPGSRVPDARLNWFIEHHHVFTNAQCGFRKHRSAVNHILVLDSEVRACFSQKSPEHLGAVFFEAAYDTVLRHGILQKLFKYGVRGRMGMFIQNFLTHCHFRVRVGLHSPAPSLRIIESPRAVSAVWPYSLSR